MAPWTLQERMTLHVLFGHHKLDFYGRAWWALHYDITHTERTERTCREDYKYSHGKERTKMYPMRILKPYAQYDPEERAAYDKAFQDVIDSAKRQGIVLPNGAGQGGEDNEKADDEEEQVEQEEEKEEEEEVEQNGENADENEDEEDVEMEDAEEEYATAEENGSDMDDPSENDATAHENEAGNRFKIPEFSNETLLAEAEFSATRKARKTLRSAKGAREISRTKPSVPLNPASSSYPLPSHLETVARLNPSIAAGLGSPNPIVLAKSAANTPALPTADNGEPQKRASDRPKRVRVEIEKEPPVTVAASESSLGRPKKQLASVGDAGSWLSAYLSSDLNKDVEGKSGERRDDSDNEPMKETKSDTTKNRISEGGFSKRLDTVETPGKTSKELRRKRASLDQGTSKKPKAQAQLNIAKSSKSSTRDQDQIKRQIKPATPEVTLPLTQVTEQANVAEALPVRGKKYEAWCRENLDRILSAEPFDMFPNRIIVPGSRRTATENPLSADERITNFLFDMFDGKLPKKLILSTYKKVPEVDKPGRQLRKVYRILVDKAEELSAVPRYQLEEVFESEESPFSNFRLATNAFGQDLKMLHMSDVDYTGVGNQQLVAFAKTKNRHLTADDIDFIKSDDPVFKRGGRVHKLWIRQQECPILGDCKKYNTAHVCIDVMICQEAHCPKCSKDDDIGTQLKSITNLPRVHSRHVAPGDKFVAPLPKISRTYEKDYKDEFIVDISIGVQSVELWDGTKQDVVVCDRSNCPGCFEASGGIVQRPNAN